MSKRSESFKKNKSSIKNLKHQFEYNYYASAFCSLLGLTDKDLYNFIMMEKENKIDSLFTKKYVILNKDKYYELSKSVNEAYMAGEKNGEKKEHERHFREEMEAFDRGVKCGKEQQLNNFNNNKKDQIMNKNNEEYDERLNTSYKDIKEKLDEHFNKVFSDFEKALKEFLNY